MPCDGSCHDGQLCAEGHCYTEASCGDGIKQGDEQCDDGNDSSADGCLNNCTLAECGDGVVWQGEEYCDLGPLNEALFEAACRTDCTACGDGVLQEEDWSERCDNGELNGQDAPTLDPPFCRLDCTYCGDGTVQASHGESCDDGNTDNNDFCLNDCSARFAADGAPLELPATDLRLNSLWHGSNGLLYVASTDAAGKVVVQESSDGETWSTTDLGSPGRPLRNPRLFEIAPGHLAVTARSESTPQKSYLRDWTDTPATARDWLLLSDALGEEGQPPDHGLVIELADGTFVVFFDGGWHWISPSLETIAAGAGDGTPLVVTPARWFPLLARDEDRLFLVLFGEDMFELYEPDDLFDFNLRADATTGQTVHHGGLWYDEGGLLLCGAMTSGGGTVQLWRLTEDDAGAWQIDEQPVPYATNLNAAASDSVACHIDGTGVYVLFRDEITGQAQILQPEAS
jgi:cysteine-rich repeat protein